MPSVDYIVVGQGLAGSWLSYFLLQHGQQVLVVDAYQPQSASRVAAGVLNPITGKYWVKTWKADQLFPFAQQAYHQLSQVVGNENSYFHDCPLVWRLTTEHNVKAFTQLLEKTDFQPFVQSIETEPFHSDVLQPCLAYGTVAGGGYVNTRQLLDDYRVRLMEKNLLLNTSFHLNEVEWLPDGVRWNGITAKKVLLCEGYSGHENPLFTSLPFAPVKGEALLVHIPNLELNDCILKGATTLVPMGEDLYWVGSTYEHRFTDVQPTTEVREKLLVQLQTMVKVPATVVDHWAAVRPASRYRRPLVGLHPHRSQVGVFNGLGTKGASLAPYFAHQFVRHLLYGVPMEEEVRIERFFT